MNEYDKTNRLTDTINKLVFTNGERARGEASREKN